MGDSMLTSDCRQAREASITNAFDLLAYSDALALTSNTVERMHLQRRVAELQLSGHASKDGRSGPDLAVP